MKERLLVTGLTGKSGLVFAKCLSEKKYTQVYNIAAVVRPTSDVSQLREWLPEMELCEGNLSDPTFLKQVTKGVDILFHIAGIHSSLPLVEAAHENGTKAMVLVHTTGIYSKYKAAGEEYRQIDRKVKEIMQDRSGGGKGVTILRPTMIYGTLQDKNIVKFIQMVDKLNPMPVVNHADSRLQPVHASDLGHAYMQVLENLDHVLGKDYVLSGRDEIRLRDMFALIADELGVQRQFISVPLWLAYAGAVALWGLSLGRFDMREKVQRLCEDRVYSHDEATQDFGYDPMPFEDGLRQEVREYKRARASG